MIGGCYGNWNKFIVGDCKHNVVRNADQQIVP